MRIHLTVLLGILFLACTPQLRKNTKTQLPPLDEKDLVVVVNKLYSQPIDAINIGIVKASDNTSSVSCTYYENENNLEELARKSGANLIEIIEHKKPNAWSSCHRLKGRLYRVTNPKFYETRIKWRPDRKLTWEDFKGEPDLEEFPNALAVTNSGFGYEAAYNLFKNGKIVVESVFNTYESWVLPQGRTDYVLQHEQIHFDITEIYSRKLRKTLSDAKVTADQPERAQRIFEQIFEEMRRRQAKYDQETQRGDKRDTQETWKAIVELELAKYDLYKSPD